MASPGTLSFPIREISVKACCRTDHRASSWSMYYKARQDYECTVDGLR